MASRYLVTGVQLGMLMAIDDVDERKKLVEEIEDKQFVGNSNNGIVKDADKLAEALYA
jgi:hypothetical protein